VFVTHNERDVSILVHYVSGMIRFGDQGSQRICSETHRLGIFHYPTKIDHTSHLEAAGLDSVQSKLEKFVVSLFDQQLTKHKAEKKIAPRRQRKC